MKDQRLLSELKSNPVPFAGTFTSSFPNAMSAFRTSLMAGSAISRSIASVSMSSISILGLTP